VALLIEFPTWELNVVLGRLLSSPKLQKNTVWGSFVGKIAGRNASATRLGTLAVEALAQLPLGPERFGGDRWSRLL